MKKTINYSMTLFLCIITLLSVYSLNAYAANKWTYTDKLPGNVTSDKYDIEYKNKYSVYDTSSPGKNWKKTENTKTEKSENYWSDFELETGENRELVTYSYYHYCSPSGGDKISYKKTKTLSHYDHIDIDITTVAETKKDESNPDYTLYHLTVSGLDYYCGKATCAEYLHDGRSFLWYKKYCYSDKITYNEYINESEWVTQKDSKASSVEIRYRLKEVHKHSYSEWKVTEKASFSKAGSEYRICGCGDKQTQKIPKVNASLSSSSFIYNGNAQKPEVSVKNSENNKLKTSQYSIAYKNSSSKKIGTYNVTVKLKGAYYTGSKTLTYNILPGKVSSLKAKAGKDKITLTWNELPGDVRYSVYSYNTSKDEYTKIASTGKTSYTVTSLKSNKTYKYSVRAYKTTGNNTLYGKNSKVVSATTLGKPSQVKNISVKSVSNKTITLTWSKVSGSGTKYIVYSINQKNNKHQKVATCSKNTYTITSLKPETSYKFAVRAYRKDGTTTYYGKMSSLISAKTAKTLKAPNKVSQIKLNLNGKVKEIKISWKSVSNATGYEIFRKTGSGNKYRLVGTVGSKSTKFTDKTASPATKYYYKVRAYKNGLGQDVKGDFSPALNIFSYAALKEKLSYNDLSFKFVNSDVDFGYDSKYRMPDRIYTTMFDSDSADTVKELFDGPWGGDCFGISLAGIYMNLAKTGISVKSFNSDAKKMTDLSLDDKGSLNIKLRDFLEMLQISQVADQRKIYIDVNKIIPHIKNIQKTGKPVMLGIHVGQNDGHEIVALDYQTIDSKNARILVADCNFPGEERYISLRTSETGEVIYWRYSSGLSYWGTAIDANMYGTVYDSYINIWNSRGKLTCTAESYQLADSFETPKADLNLLKTIRFAA